MKISRDAIPNTINFLQIDFPALVLQTGGIESSDNYWEQVCEQIDIVSKKYNSNSFVDHMLIAYSEYLSKMCVKAEKIREERRQSSNEQNERI